MTATAESSSTAVAEPDAPVPVGPPVDAGDEVVAGDADPPQETPGGIDLKFRPDVEGLRGADRPLDRKYVAGLAAREDGRHPRTAPDRDPHPD